jgi:hypothetical protein
MRALRKTGRRALPAVALATVAGLVPALGAGAATSTTGTISPLARTQAETAISIRVAALDSALTLVQQTGWFAGSDQSSLENIINGDLHGNGPAAGLNGLAITIRNETDPAKFRSEVQSIFSAYRVYALALPQVRLVRAADRLTSDSIPNIQKIDADLKQAIAQDAAEGKNVQAAQAAVNDLDAQIAIMGQKTSGTSAALLGLTPTQWNANHDVVRPYRDDIHTAAGAARQGEKDAHAALKDLQ